MDASSSKENHDASDRPVIIIVVRGCFVAVLSKNERLVDINESETWIGLGPFTHS
jgi:hypothetical protein